MNGGLVPDIRVTFYSTSGKPRGGFNWVHAKTVAMNHIQAADLGLKLGDEIFLKAKHGEWSGFYTIGDTGCAYGTVDIYVSPGSIPSWGAENGAQIVTFCERPAKAEEGQAQ